MINCRSRGSGEWNEIRRKNEILQGIFDHIPLIINFLGQDGRIKYANRAWERTLAWTLEEVLDRNLLEIFSECFPDEQERRRALALAAESRGQWIDFKTTLRDGRIIDTSWAVVDVADGTKVAIGQDITERKRRDEELRRSERQLLAAPRLAGVGSWSWDIKSGILTWSDEVYRFFGLDPREFIPTHDAFLERVHAEDRELVGGLIERSVATKEPIDHQFRIIPSGGAVRILRSCGTVFSDERGNPVRMFGTAQDLTDQILVEEQLKTSNEKLRVLSASLRSAREEEGTRIAREIHDELGSSLTALKWDLEALSGTLSDPGIEAPVPAWRAKLEGMITITNGILHTVRRIASDLRPNLPDDPGWAEAIEAQAFEFQARTGIACTCNRLLVRIHLNRDQSTALFRILREALANVLRHAQATLVEIRMESDASDFVLSVSDNGRGITEQEKSARLSLGVLGMRERAHLVGGTTHITGISGRGTTVTVRIPLMTPGPPAIESATASEYDNDQTSYS